VSLEAISDVKVLRGVAAYHYKENRRLKAELSKALEKLSELDGTQAVQLALKLQALEKSHAKAIKQLFGQTSERRGGYRPKNKDKPQTGHGPREQLELPIQEVKHKLPEDLAVCDLCEKPLAEWEGQTEDSLEVDFIEPQLVLKKHLRQKYRCECGGCIKVAPGPRKLFPKARYSVNFALTIALQKYCYHLPLDRQRRELKRRGLDVSTVTLWDYVHKVAELLRPAYERLPEHILAQSVVGADETTWRLLKTEKPGKSKTWWVWARRAEDAVHYKLAPSRGGEIAKELFEGFEGTILCDGYSVYESLSKNSSKLHLANCWSHGRREFLPHAGDRGADRILRVISRMYKLEAKVKGRPPDEVLRLRQKKTRRLLEAFFKWLRTQEAIPGSALHRAMKYILKREESLMRFLDDPLLSPDNNATERIIRGLVIGRKNHYGSRSERGTEVAAILYSLLDSAELAGINPHTYLRDALGAALAGEIIPLPHEML
jgi:transposase